MTHAIEGYITKGAWEMTDMLHIKAIELIGRFLPDSVAGDQIGREKWLLLNISLEWDSQMSA